MNQSHTIFSDILPTAYAEVSALAQLVGENMLARLELVTMQPKVIVDLGCGTGYCTSLLQQHYPEALIMGLDSEEAMVRYASLNNRAKFVCADAGMIPLPNYSVDLIFANFLFPWCDDWERLFRECKRVLRADGLLMFSCLGLDTLRELQENHLILKDMHEIGDELVQAKFSDPVMDVEYVTLSYHEYKKMCYELRMNGMIAMPLPCLEKHDPENAFLTTFEVIYGHAWGVGELAEFQADAEGAVKIPLSHLRKMMAHQ